MYAHKTMNTLCNPQFYNVPVTVQDDQVYLNGYFMRTRTWAAPVLALSTFLASISFPPIIILAGGGGGGGLVEVTKTTTVVTVNITYTEPVYPIE